MYIRNFFDTILFTSPNFFFFFFFLLKERGGSQERRREKNETITSWLEKRVKRNGKKEKIRSILKSIVNSNHHHIPPLCPTKTKQRKTTTINKMKLLIFSSFRNVVVFDHVVVPYDYVWKLVWIVGLMKQYIVFFVIFVMYP